MHNHSVLIRLISLVLIGAFLCQELSYAAPSVLTPAPSDVFSSFQAPTEFSSLKELRQGLAGKPFIIHIQDAHSNLSGQENLAKTLDEIMTRYKVSTVLVEGGGTDGTLDPLKKLASPEIIKRIAKKLLIEGKLAGEEYLNLTSNHKMKIMGIEDMALYQKSIENYAKLADRRESILEYLARTQRSADKLKQKLYPSELVVYERQKEKDAEGALGFKFKELLNLAKSKQVDITVFSNLQKLSILEEKEKSIDFNLANLEQAGLIEKIRDRGLRIEDLGKFKNSRASQFSFFQNIFNIAKEKKIVLESCPNLLKYYQYLQNFTDLDLEEVLSEAERLEDKVYVAWLPKEDARLLRAIDRYLALLNVAYRIQMSTKDFEFFKVNEPDFSTATYQAFLNRKLMELGYFEDVIPYKNILEEGKKALEDFYDSVSQRDLAFIKNTERVLAQSSIQNRIAVLITGGYHTSHLKQLFQQQGFSYAVLTPIVTGETNQKKYEKLLLSSVRREAKTVEVVQGESRKSRSLIQLDADLSKTSKKEGARFAGAVMTAARLAQTLSEFEGFDPAVLGRIRNEFAARLASQGVPDGFLDVVEEVRTITKDSHPEYDDPHQRTKMPTIISETGSSFYYTHRFQELVDEKVGFYSRRGTDLSFIRTPDDLGRFIELVLSIKNYSSRLKRISGNHQSSSRLESIFKKAVRIFSMIQPVSDEALENETEFIQKTYQVNVSAESDIKLSQAIGAILMREGLRKEDVIRVYRDGQLVLRSAQIGTPLAGGEKITINARRRNVSAVFPGPSPAGKKLTAPRNRDQESAIVIGLVRGWKREGLLNSHGWLKGVADFLGDRTRAGHMSHGIEDAGLLRDFISLYSGVDNDLDGFEELKQRYQIASNEEIVQRLNDAMRRVTDFIHGIEGSTKELRETPLSEVALDTKITLYDVGKHPRVLSLIRRAMNEPGISEYMGSSKSSRKKYTFRILLSRGKNLAVRWGDGREIIIEVPSYKIRLVDFVRDLRQEVGSFSQAVLPIVEARSRTILDMDIDHLFDHSDQQHISGKIFTSTLEDLFGEKSDYVQEIVRGDLPKELIVGIRFKILKKDKKSRSFLLEVQYDYGIPASIFRAEQETKTKEVRLERLLTPRIEDADTKNNPRLSEDQIKVDEPTGLSQASGMFLNETADGDESSLPKILIGEMSERFSVTGRRPLVVVFGAGHGQSLSEIIHDGKSNVLALDLDPYLESYLAETIGEASRMHGFGDLSQEEAFRVLSEAENASAGFQQIDLSNYHAPQFQRADGAVLHRVFSVIADPDQRQALLKEIYDSLKPDGVFSFLDFEVIKKSHPIYGKSFDRRYQITKNLIEKGLVGTAQMRSLVSTPDTYLLAVIRKKDSQGTLYDYQEYLGLEEELVKRMESSGDLKLDFVAVHLSEEGMKAVLQAAGFKVLESQSARVPARLFPGHTLLLAGFVVQKPDNLYENAIIEMQSLGGFRDRNNQISPVVRNSFIDGERLNLDRIRKSLAHKHESIRLYVAHFLGELHKSEPHFTSQIYPILVDILKRESYPSTREAAVEELIKMASPEVIEAVIALFKEKKESPREDASTILVGMGDSAVPSLIKAVVQYDDRRLARGAYGTLFNMPPKNVFRFLMPLARPMMSDDIRSLLRGAILQFGSLNEKSHEEVVSMLMEAFEIKLTSINSYAESALVDLSRSPEAKKLILKRLRVLSDAPKTYDTYEGQGLRVRATKLLTKLNSAARLAISEKAVSGQPDDELREWVKGLSRFDTAPDPTVMYQTALERFLKQKMPLLVINPLDPDHGSHIREFLKRFVTTDKTDLENKVRRLFGIYEKYSLLVAELERRVARKEPTIIQSAPKIQLLFVSDGANGSPMRNAAATYNNDRNVIALNVDYLLDPANDIFGIEIVAHEAAHSWVIRYLDRSSLRRGLTEDEELYANWAATPFLSKAEIQKLIEDNIRIKSARPVHQGTPHTVAHLSVFALKNGISAEIVKPLWAPSADLVSQYADLYEQLRFVSAARLADHEHRFKRVQVGEMLRMIEGWSGNQVAFSLHFDAAVGDYVLTEKLIKLELPNSDHDNPNRPDSVLYDGVADAKRAATVWRGLNQNLERNKSSLDQFLSGQEALVFGEGNGFEETLYLLKNTSSSKITSIDVDFRNTLRRIKRYVSDELDDASRARITLARDNILSYRQAKPVQLVYANLFIRQELFRDDLGRLWGKLDEFLSPKGLIVGATGQGYDGAGERRVEAKFDQFSNLDGAVFVRKRAAARLASLEFPASWKKWLASGAVVMGSFFSQATNTLSGELPEPTIVAQAVPKRQSEIEKFKNSVREQYKNNPKMLQAYDDFVLAMGKPGGVTAATMESAQLRANAEPLFNALLSLEAMDPANKTFFEKNLTEQTLFHALIQNFEAAGSQGPLRVWVRAAVLKAMEAKNDKGVLLLINLADAFWAQDKSRLSDLKEKFESNVPLFIKHVKFTGTSYEFVDLENLEYSDAQRFVDWLLTIRLRSADVRFRAIDFMLPEIPASSLSSRMLAYFIINSANLEIPYEGVEYDRYSQHLKFALHGFLDRLQYSRDVEKELKWQEGFFRGKRDIRAIYLPFLVSETYRRAFLDVDKDMNAHFHRANRIRLINAILEMEDFNRDPLARGMLFLNGGLDLQMKLVALMHHAVRHQKDMELQLDMKFYRMVAEKILMKIELSVYLVSAIVDTGEIFSYERFTETLAHLHGLLDTKLEKDRVMKLMTPSVVWLLQRAVNPVNPRLPFDPSGGSSWIQALAEANLFDLLLKNLQSQKDRLTAKELGRLELYFERVLSSLSAEQFSDTFEKISLEQFQQWVIFWQSVHSASDGESNKFFETFILRIISELHGQKGVSRDKADLLFQSLFQSKNWQEVFITVLKRAIQIADDEAGEPNVASDFWNPEALDSALDAYWKTPDSSKRVDLFFEILALAAPKARQTDRQIKFFDGLLIRFIPKFIDEVTQMRADPGQKNKASILEAEFFWRVERILGRKTVGEGVYDVILPQLSRLYPYLSDMSKEDLLVWVIKNFIGQRVPAERRANSVKSLLAEAPRGLALLVADRINKKGKYWFASNEEEAPVYLNFLDSTLVGSLTKGIKPQEEVVRAHLKNLGTGFVVAKEQWNSKDSTEEVKQEAAKEIARYARSFAVLNALAEKGMLSDSLAKKVNELEKGFEQAVPQGTQEIIKSEVAKLLEPPGARLAAASQTNKAKVASLTTRARNLREQGEFEEARRLLMEARGLGPHDKHVHNGLGLLAWKQRRADEAMAHFKRTLKINPRNKVALNSLGEIAFSQGRFEDARGHFGDVLKFDRENLFANGYLGRIAFEEGRLEKAREYFESILRRDPQNELAVDYLRQIGPKKKDPENIVRPPRKSSAKVGPSAGSASKTIPSARGSSAVATEPAEDHKLWFSDHIFLQLHRDNRRSDVVVQVNREGYTVASVTLKADPDEVLESLGQSLVSYLESQLPQDLWSNREKKQGEFVKAANQALGKYRSAKTAARLGEKETKGTMVDEDGDNPVPYTTQPVRLSWSLEEIQEALLELSTSDREVAEKVIRRMMTHPGFPPERLIQNILSPTIDPKSNVFESRRNARVASLFALGEFLNPEDTVLASYSQSLKGDPSESYTVSMIDPGLQERTKLALRNQFQQELTSRVPMAVDWEELDRVYSRFSSDLNYRLGPLGLEGSGWTLLQWMALTRRWHQDQKKRGGAAPLHPFESPSYSDASVLSVILPWFNDEAVNQKVFEWGIDGARLAKKGLNQEEEFLRSYIAGMGQVSGETSVVKAQVASTARRLYTALASMAEPDRAKIGALIGSYLEANADLSPLQKIAFKWTGSSHHFIEEFSHGQRSVNPDPLRKYVFDQMAITDKNDEVSEVLFNFMKLNFKLAEASDTKRQKRLIWVTLFIVASFFLLHLHHVLVGWNWLNEWLDPPNTAQRSRDDDLNQTLSQIKNNPNKVNQEQIKVLSDAVSQSYLSQDQKIRALDTHLRIIQNKNLGAERAAAMHSLQYLIENKKIPSAYENKIFFGILELFVEDRTELLQGTRAQDQAAINGHQRFMSRARDVLQKLKNDISLSNQDMRRAVKMVLKSDDNILFSITTIILPKTQLQQDETTIQSSMETILTEIKENPTGFSPQKLFTLREWFVEIARMPQGPGLRGSIIELLVDIESANDDTSQFVWNTVWMMSIENESLTEAAIRRLDKGFMTKPYRFAISYLKDHSDVIPQVRVNVIADAMIRRIESSSIFEDVKDEAAILGQLITRRMLSPETLQKAVPALQSLIGMRGKDRERAHDTIANHAVQALVGMAQDGKLSNEAAERLIDGLVNELTASKGLFIYTNALGDLHRQGKISTEKKSAIVETLLTLWKDGDATDRGWLLDSLALFYESRDLSRDQADAITDLLMDIANNIVSVPDQRQKATRLLFRRLSEDGMAPKKHGPQVAFLLKDSFLGEANNDAPPKLLWAPGVAEHIDASDLRRIIQKLVIENSAKVDDRLLEIIKEAFAQGKLDGALIDASIEILSDISRGLSNKSQAAGLQLMEIAQHPSLNNGQRQRVTLVVLDLLKGGANFYSVGSSENFISFLGGEGNLLKELFPRPAVSVKDFFQSKDGVAILTGADLALRFVKKGMLSTEEMKEVFDLALGADYAIRNEVRVVYSFFQYERPRIFLLLTEIADRKILGADPVARLTKLLLSAISAPDYQFDRTAPTVLARLLKSGVISKEIFEKEKSLWLSDLGSKEDKWWASGAKPLIVLSSVDMVSPDVLRRILQRVEETPVNTEIVTEPLPHLFITAHLLMSNLPEEDKARIAEILIRGVEVNPRETVGLIRLIEQKAEVLKKKTPQATKVLITAYDHELSKKLRQNDKIVEALTILVDLGWAGDEVLVELEAFFQRESRSANTSVYIKQLADEGLKAISKIKAKKASEGEKGSGARLSKQLEEIGTSYQQIVMEKLKKLKTPDNEEHIDSIEQQGKMLSPYQWLLIGIAFSGNKTLEEIVADIPDQPTDLEGQADVVDFLSMVQGFVQNATYAELIPAELISDEALLFMTRRSDEDPAHVRQIRILGKDLVDYYLEEAISEELGSDVKFMEFSEAPSAKDLLGEWTSSIFSIGEKQEDFVGYIRGNGIPTRRGQDRPFWEAVRRQASALTGLPEDHFLYIPQKDILRWVLAGFSSAPKGGYRTRLSASLPGYIVINSDYGNFSMLKTMAHEASHALQDHGANPLLAIEFYRVVTEGFQAYMEHKILMDWANEENDFGKKVRGLLEKEIRDVRVREERRKLDIERRLQLDVTEFVMSVLFDGFKDPLETEEPEPDLDAALWEMLDQHRSSYAAERNFLRLLIGGGENLNRAQVVENLEALEIFKDSNSERLVGRIGQDRYALLVDLFDVLVSYSWLAKYESTEDFMYRAIYHLALALPEDSTASKAETAKKIKSFLGVLIKSYIKSYKTFKSDGLDPRRDFAIGINDRFSLGSEPLNEVLNLAQQWIKDEIDESQTESSLNTLFAVIASSPAARMATVMLPQTHGNLEVVDRELLGVWEVTALVRNVNLPPHLVSIPVQKLPRALKSLLLEVSVEVISGERKSLFAYLQEHVDEVIFTPFLIDILPDGTIHQLGGGIIHDSFSEPISQLSLTANPDRPGKRIIYVNLFRLMSSQGIPINHVNEMSAMQYQPLGETDLVQHIAEEVAHLETIKLVSSGQLHEKYYDRPNFNWFEKIGNTVKLNTLKNLQGVLIRRNQSAFREATEYYEQYAHDIKVNIRGFNQALGLPENDFSFTHLRELPSAARLALSWEAISEITDKEVSELTVDDLVQLLGDDGYYTRKDYMPGRNVDPESGPGADQDHSIWLSVINPAGEEEFLYSFSLMREGSAKSFGEKFTVESVYEEDTFVVTKDDLRNEEEATFAQEKEFTRSKDPGLIEALLLFDQKDERSPGGFYVGMQVEEGLFKIGTGNGTPEMSDGAVTTFKRRVASSFRLLEIMEAAVEEAHLKANTSFSQVAPERERIVARIQQIRDLSIVFRDMAEEVRFWPVQDPPLVRQMVDQIQMILRQMFLLSRAAGIELSEAMEDRLANDIMGDFFMRENGIVYLGIDTDRQSLFDLVPDTQDQVASLRESWNEALDLYMDHWAFLEGGAEIDSDLLDDGEGSDIEGARLAQRKILTKTIGLDTVSNYLSILELQSKLQLPLTAAPSEIKVPSWLLDPAGVDADAFATKIAPYLRDLLARVTALYPKTMITPNPSQKYGFVITSEDKGENLEIAYTDAATSDDAGYFVVTERSNKIASNAGRLLATLHLNGIIADDSHHEQYIVDSGDQVRRIDLPNVFIFDNSLVGTLESQYGISFEDSRTMNIRRRDGFEEATRNEIAALIFNRQNILLSPQFIIPFAEAYIQTYKENSLEIGPLTKKYLDNVLVSSRRALEAVESERQAERSTKRLNEIFNVAAPVRDFSEADLVDVESVDGPAVELLARWYVKEPEKTGEAVSFEIITKHAIVTITPQEDDAESAEILFYHLGEYEKDPDSAKPFGRIPLSKNRLGAAKDANQRASAVPVAAALTLEAEALAAAVKTGSIDRSVVKILRDNPQVLTNLSTGKQVVISQAIHRKSDDSVAGAEMELIQKTILAIRTLLGSRGGFVHFEFTDPSGVVDSKLSEDISGLKEGDFERIYVAVPNVDILTLARGKSAGFISLPDRSKNEGLIPYQAVYLSAILVALSDDMNEPVQQALNKLIFRESSRKLELEDFKAIKEVVSIDEDKYKDLAVMVVPVNFTAVLQAARLAIQAVGAAA